MRYTVMCCIKMILVNDGPHKRPWSHKITLPTDIIMMLVHVCIHCHVHTVRKMSNNAFQNVFLLLSVV